VSLFAAEFRPLTRLPLTPRVGFSFEAFFPLG
jgi:hypothetical protein